MSDTIQPCPCAALVPVSVSITADDDCSWHSILECPACGVMTSASAHEAIPALIRAVSNWNTDVATSRLYRFPGAMRRS